MSHACAQDKSLWRALLSSKVGLVVVVTFFGVSLSHTSAESQDITPPTLTAFSFTPTIIDTRSQQAVVTVSVSATDDLSGVQTVQARFASPSGQWRYASSSFYSSPPTSLSTTMNATFPQFSETGIWRVDFVSLTDALGNFRTYHTPTLNQLGFPTKLVVGEQEDAGMPLEPSIQPDFDADGKTDIAVYRPSTGVWFILNSASSTGRTQRWGALGDIPVAGDYNGGGRTDFAVYRPSTGVWFILNSVSFTSRVQQWGALGDSPVPGDYDGDGKTDIAVYRPSTGVWFIFNSASFTGREQQWGALEDIPVPGDYDGDGKTDIAVYRPSTGVWFIFNSASFTGREQQWGVPGDQPLPGQF